MTDFQKSGTPKPSFCSTLMEDENFVKSTENFEFDLKWTANSMYAASIDTVRYFLIFPPLLGEPKVFSYFQTITSISHFLLAMMQHPEVLKKAQQEIDAVVGQDRLPSFEDRASLPYGWS